MSSGDGEDSRVDSTSKEWDFFFRFSFLVLGLPRSSSELSPDSSLWRFTWEYPGGKDLIISTSVSSEELSLEIV